MRPDNVKWFVNAMETRVIKLPELHGQYQNLQNKVQTEHYQKQKLEGFGQVYCYYYYYYYYYYLSIIFLIEL